MADVAEALLHSAQAEINRLRAELADVQEKYERTERQWIADVRMWQQECRAGATKDARIAELEKRFATQLARTVDANARIELAEAERDALQKVLHTIWESPTTASWILELIEASGAIAAPQ